MASLEEVNDIAKQARDFRNKVNSILELEEDRGKLFDALRAYHESRKIKKFVRDLKVILSNSRRYPLFKEIRSLIPQEHLFAYDKLTEGARTGERIIRVKRHGNESLGIKFKGGLEHGIGVFVTSIISGSAAHAAGLKIGDEILKINGLVLQDSIHEEVVNLFKDKKSVTLVVKNAGKVPTKINNEIVWEEVDPNSQTGPPDLWDKSLIHLATSSDQRQPVDNKLSKDDRLLAFKIGKEGLGCSIRSGIPGFRGIYVSVVAKDSLAEQVGLKTGDQILNVNGKNFKGIKHSEAVDVLKARVELTMIVRHNKQVEEHFIRRKSAKEGGRQGIQPILKKGPGATRISSYRANFGESLSVQVIDRDASDNDDLEDSGFHPVIPNPSNLEYDETVRQGKEVHLISIPKTAPLMLDLHQIRGRIVVVNVGKGGAAAEHGFIRRGDYLLNVEGTNLVGASVSEAQDALNEAMGRLSLYIDLIVACAPGRNPPASASEKLEPLPPSGTGPTPTSSKTSTSPSDALRKAAKDIVGVKKAIAAFESLAATPGKHQLVRRDSLDMVRNSLKLYQSKRRGDAEKVFAQQLKDEIQGPNMEETGEGLSASQTTPSPQSPNAEVVYAQVHSPPPSARSRRHVSTDEAQTSQLGLSDASQAYKTLDDISFPVVNEPREPINTNSDAKEQNIGNETEEVQYATVHKDKRSASLKQIHNGLNQDSLTSGNMVTTPQPHVSFDFSLPSTLNVQTDEEPPYSEIAEIKQQIALLEDNLPIVWTDSPTQSPSQTPHIKAKEIIDDGDGYTKVVRQEATSIQQTADTRAVKDTEELDTEPGYSNIQFKPSTVEFNVTPVSLSPSPIVLPQSLQKSPGASVKPMSSPSTNVSTATAPVLLIGPESHEGKMDQTPVHLRSADKRAPVLDQLTIPPIDYEEDNHDETYIGSDIPIQPMIPKGSLTSANVVQAALKKLNANKPDFSFRSEALAAKPEQVVVSNNSPTTLVIDESATVPAVNDASKPIFARGKSPLALNSKLLSAAKDKLRRVGLKKDSLNRQTASISKAEATEMDQGQRSQSIAVGGPENVAIVVETGVSRNPVSPPPTGMRRNASMPVMDQMMSELKDKMLNRSSSAKAKDGVSANAGQMKTENQPATAARKMFSSHENLLRDSSMNKGNPSESDRNWTQELGAILTPSLPQTQSTTRRQSSPVIHSTDRNKSNVEVERDSRIRRRQAAVIEDIDATAVAQLNSSKGQEVGLENKPRVALDMEGTLKELDDVIRSLDAED